MAGEATNAASAIAEAADEQDRASSSQTSGTKRSTPESATSEMGNPEQVNDADLDPDKRKEFRKMRRVMANRRSARESRERRKKFLLGLQESVESLTAENAELSKENLTLRQELASLVEQMGGVAALSMIPNIQSLLQSTQGLAGLSVQSPSVASGATGSTSASGFNSGGGGGTSGNSAASSTVQSGVAFLPPNNDVGRGAGGGAGVTGDSLGQL